MSRRLRVFAFRFLNRVARWVGPPATVTFVHEERDTMELGICRCCLQLAVSDEDFGKLVGVKETDAGAA